MPAILEVKMRGKIMESLDTKVTAELPPILRVMLGPIAAYKARGLRYLQSVLRSKTLKKMPGKFVCKNAPNISFRIGGHCCMQKNCNPLGGQKRLEKHLEVLDPQRPPKTPAVLRAMRYALCSMRGDWKFCNPSRAHNHLEKRSEVIRAKMPAKVL